LVIVFAILIGLLARRRWLEVSVATLVLGAFAVPWVPALVAALRTTLGKGGESLYFHTMREWVPHVAFYTVGPALLALLALLGALALVGVSWAVLTYQLLFAFEGGKTYAHASYRLEYFNYPLRLRQLRADGDSYTCVDVCPYDSK